MPFGDHQCSGVSVAPWRIPLRTAPRLTTVKPRRGLKGRRSPFRVRKGGGVATERCVPKGHSPAECKRKPLLQNEKRLFLMLLDQLLAEAHRAVTGREDREHPA